MLFFLSFYHLYFSNIPVSLYISFFSCLTLSRIVLFLCSILFCLFFFPRFSNYFFLTPYILLSVLANIFCFFIFPYSFYFNLPLLSFAFFVFYLTVCFLLFSLRSWLQSDFNISILESGLRTCLYSFSFLREIGELQPIILN